MIKISKNTPLNKQDLIDLLNKILEKNDFWARNTTVRFMESKQNELFKEVDKLLYEQSQLELTQENQLVRWRQINDETEKIYKKIDEIGKCWKYE